MSFLKRIFSNIGNLIAGQGERQANFRRMIKSVKMEMKANRPFAAMQILGPFLGYPAKPEHEDRQMWSEAMTLFAQICEAAEIDGGLVRVGGDASDPSQANALATLLRSCAGDPDDLNTLVLLSEVLPGVNAGGIGAMMLARAVKLDPGNGILRHKLATLLLDVRLYEESVQVLCDAPSTLDEPLRLRYTLIWAYLHQGRLNDARKEWALTQLPQEGEDRYVYSIVSGMMQRIEAYNKVAYLHTNDLRGWNFAFNGSILLHLSPYGEDVMHGRYGALYEGEAVCLESIVRLAAVLAACTVPVPRVYALPDRDSRILAKATASHFNCELIPWPEEGTDDPGLIVIHDLSEVPLPLLRSMRSHHKHQIVWAHAVSWMDDVPVGPDLISYLYEYNLSPWAERPPGAGSSIAKQRTGTVEELAATILSADIEDNVLDDLPELCKWVSSLPTLPDEHAPGLFRDSGDRRIFFSDSPVLSASFRYNRRD